MVSSTIPTPPARSSRSRLPWILGCSCALIALALVLVLVAASVWYFTLRQTPESVVEDYLVAWEATDCERFKEITTEEHRGEDFTCEEWSSNISQQFEQGYTFDHELTGTEITGDRAAVRVEETLHLEGEGSAFQIFDVILVKENGSWLISDFETVKEIEEI